MRQGTAHWYFFPNKCGMEEFCFDTVSQELLTWCWYSVTEAVDMVLMQCHRSCWQYTGDRSWLSTFCTAKSHILFGVKMKNVKLQVSFFWLILFAHNILPFLLISQERREFFFFEILLTKCSFPYHRQYFHCSPGLKWCRKNADEHICIAIRKESRRLFLWIALFRDSSESLAINARKGSE